MLLESKVHFTLLLCEISGIMLEFSSKFDKIVSGKNCNQILSGINSVDTFNY